MQYNRDPVRQIRPYWYFAGIARLQTLKIFDPYIRSRTQGEDDLKNLHYFGTTEVVTTTHDARPFETADDLIAYFEVLLGKECRRLRRCGLIPHVALGVLPAARPRRAHYEVWEKLEDLLGRPSVVALGEVGVWEDNDEHWELFARQVEIARRVGPIPILVTPPNELKITLTYKMMTWLKRQSYPPSMVTMSRLDERLLENVVESGFCAGYPVGAASNDPRRAGEHIADLVARVGGADKILLTTALRRQAGDVLGVSKAIKSLRKHDVSEEAIRNMVYDNAARLFRPPGEDKDEQ